MFFKNYWVVKLTTRNTNALAKMEDSFANVNCFYQLVQVNKLCHIDNEIYILVVLSVPVRTQY